MTELADALTVRRWAAGQGRNMSVATLRMFRKETGQGISRAALIEILSGTRMKPTLDDLETLPTMPPSDASIRAEVLVHLTSALLKVATPDDLGAFFREWSRYRGLVVVDRIVPTWQEAIERIAEQAEVALSIAGEPDAQGEDHGALTYDEVLASRERSTIAQWGTQAREAALYARLDLLAARGLEDACEDGLVRLAHLV